MQMLNQILYLFFPTVCAACDLNLEKNEAIICTICRHKLPVTNFFSSSQNAIHQIIGGKLPVQLATSLFYFDKDTEVQKLLHNLKYKNQQKIGNLLGHWHGSKLIADSKFKNIDIVIPIPLHKKRHKERGYNQVTDYAKQLASYLNITYNDTVLKKNKNTKTQSKHGRQERFENILNSISLNNIQGIENKHVLLVDDIITTGATLQACFQSLQDIKGIKISIASMAVTLLEDV